MKQEYCRDPGVINFAQRLLSASVCMCVCVSETDWGVEIV